MSNKTINYCPRPKWERWTGSNRCPNCGGAEIEYNTQIVLASYPPQSQLRCKSCGHIFSSGVASEWTNKDTLDELWQHDQSILNTPYIGDPPPGTMPQIGDWPFIPSIPESPSYPDIYIPSKDSKVGWICPKCGRCLAPHVDSCPHCNNYPRGLIANIAVFDDAMDGDLKDIITGKGIKNADTHNTDGSGIYKEMHYD